MKKNILFMIFGMFIMACISISVYAINANEITYNNTTVDQAINTLYTTQNTTVSNLTNQISSLQATNSEQASTITSLQSQLASIQSCTVNTSTSYAQYSGGNAIVNRTLSQTVSKGKYIVTVAYALGTTWNANDASSEIDYAPTCDSDNCTIEKIKGLTHNRNSSNNCGAAKAYVSLTHTLYLVNISENTDTIRMIDTLSDSTIATNATILSMEIVKID